MGVQTIAQMSPQGGRDQFKDLCRNQPAITCLLNGFGIQEGSRVQLGFRDIGVTVYRQVPY